VIQYVDKNKYKITLDCGFINGKRKRISRIIIGTKAEAKIREAELIKQIKAGKYQNKESNLFVKSRFVKKENLTFKDLTNIFLEDFCKNSLKQNTISSYKFLLKIILKEIGDFKIKDITPYILQCFYNKLKNEYKFTPNYCRHYYILINNIFEKNIKWQIIDVNVNKCIDKPKIIKQEANIYNYEEIGKLLEALSCEPIKRSAPIMLCIDTGMRREELNGLKWENVNFETNEINIEQVRIAVDKEIIVETPKTFTSKRRIVATDKSIEYLKRLKEYQNETAKKLNNKWSDTGYVFVKDTGLPYHPNTISYIFKNIQRKYNLPKLTLHQLRHTSASILIDNNEDVSSVSARLGHANIYTTLNMYTHAVDKLGKKPAQTMNNVLQNL